MRCRFIKDNLQDYPLSLSFRILKVSRSGLLPLDKKKNSAKKAGRK
jgi:hypothetical protein